MENYTKYALKPWEELAALVEDKENIFVISCNKCFKAFETPEEPECDTLLSLAADKERAKAGITGVEIAAKIIKECRPYCQGVHIMALGWEAKVPRSWNWPVSNITT